VRWYWELSGHGDKILSLALSSDGRRAATTSYGSSIRLWEVDRSAPKDRIRSSEADNWVESRFFHSHRVTACATFCAGDLTATASTDGTLGIWSQLNAERLKSLRRHGNAVTAWAWSFKPSLLKAATRQWRASCPYCRSIFVPSLLDLGKVFRCSACGEESALNPSVREDNWKPSFPERG